MSVKVSLKEKAATVKEYPKLMIDNGLIILFERYEQGMIIQGDGFIAGIYSKHWDMINFKDYDGEVTLKNEQICGKR